MEYKKREHTPDWLASALFGNQRYEVHWLGYHAILRLAFLEPCFVLAPAGSPPMIRRVGETWPGCELLIVSTIPLEKSRIKYSVQEHKLQVRIEATCLATVCLCLAIHPIILANQCLFG